MAMIAITSGIQINKRGGDNNSFCEKKHKSEDEKKNMNRRWSSLAANRDTPIVRKKVMPDEYTPTLSPVSMFEIAVSSEL
jgi:hypothetical protein